MSVTSTAVLTRARVARRVVALLLVVAGVLACALSLLGVTGGFLGDFRFYVTLAFLILGPGWAAAGFLRRAPAAHVWLLTIGVGVATTLLVSQVMVSAGIWRPAVALYAMTVISIPFLLRHAVVAQ
ncbi:MAG: hypothetical protein QOG20_1384 [Pseudonocardiales bacterium]|uniref:hypothetical protein n=1 Tax=Pseudonocardia sp. TaxID=60912 RepID=UPI0026277B85|nr:hypothetical protein [Pseudonocardia sp.]MCW2717723.1 hypothetical protein [Pseudonocardia sp.]MDT7612806.1 hypothetical protein [Pseudonocardiales bacterium]MDT7705777.1 hypothetical protein [Pseudonocardiales bacterium]